MTIETNTEPLGATKPTYGGIAAILGAALAIVGNALIVLAAPAAAPDTVSYPLSVTQFRWAQLFFAATQALMAYGILELVRSGAVRRRRSTVTFSFLAVIGFALTVPGELVLIPVASSASDSTAAAAASTVFGVGLLIADLGLIGYGLTALRDHHWPRPWAALPATLGAFQLLVVTPVALSTGFASTPTFATITLANLLIAALGVRLVRTSQLIGQ
ncbi:hypothetical protein [Kribbella kalugense]|uniref:Uncharacterized protein n=1 Tax=Kribbella kalugense TaxID=2512221 RepID=A0A4R7ZEL9_9ACTN|nr:hypothetical protein [Kribbella kalugense]TDW15386.1 hypothetical protein EV650_6868 [Kribbella kalugense]